MLALKGVGCGGKVEVNDIETQKELKNRQLDPNWCRPSKKVLVDDSLVNTLEIFTKRWPLDASWADQNYIASKGLQKPRVVAWVEGYEGQEGHESDANYASKKANKTKS